MPQPIEEQNGVQRVIDIAIESTWIKLAIEKYKSDSDGTTLDSSTENRLVELSVSDILSLRNVSNQIATQDPVIKIVLSKTWMQLAKEKYIKMGGSLDEHEHAALNCISDEELETLQTLANRLIVEAPGWTGDAGGIY